MSCEDKDKAGLLRSQVVRGEPYRVAGRTLTPEARIVSIGRARATIGTRQYGGWGFAFTWVIPTALIEETEDGERRFPIPDTTANALRGIWASAVALVVFFTTIRWLAGRRKKG
jgi:hypothetical protein